MEFSLIKKEEIPLIKKMVADANCLRVIFFAPALTIYILTEFFSDWKIMHSPAYKHYLFKFFGFETNVFNIYVILDLLIVVFSLVIFFVALFYRKKPQERQDFFLTFMKLYVFALFTISFAVVVVTAYTDYDMSHVDFTFFYLIALVSTSVFFSNFFITVPLCIIYFVAMHVLIAICPNGIVYKPHVPYGIFLVIALCFVSVFRAFNLLSTLRYENQIEKFKNEAVRQNALKSMFLANMSHEIRTPMNAIVGMSEIAQDFPLNPSQKNTIRQIHSSGIALVSIINDILDFSKIEAGKMEIVPSEYDIMPLLHDVANICMVKLAGKDVDVRIQIDSGLPKILRGDDIRIKQVLINLGGNAAKFTDKGSISIRAERDKSQANGIKFSVSDTGIGIKKQDLEEIFSEFRQVDMSMNRTKGGTGLGLAISRNLVHLMGGQLEVASEYTKGSVFYFSIPQEAVSEKTVGQSYAPLLNATEVASASDAAEADKANPCIKSMGSKVFNRIEFSDLFASDESSSSSAAEESFLAPKASILVVDDNIVNIQVAQGLLEKFGIVPDTALSGFESLEMIAERPAGKPYDIVFMDHQMPVMDGVETLKKIRCSDGMKKHTVVIALSANAVNGAREMFLQNGFDDFLSKPVQRKDFAKALKKWLPENLIQKPQAGLENKSEEWTCPPQVIATFLRLIDSSAKEIEELLLKNDLKNYTIKVHALKSSAKIVGQEEVSKLAAELEELGNKAQKANAGEKSTADNNQDDALSQIRKKTPKLIELYKSCGEKLKEYAETSRKEAAPSGGQEDKAPLTGESARTFALRIKASCKDNNLNDLEDLVKKLQAFSLTENQKKILENLKDACEMIDFDQAAVLAESLTL
ncbi:MAG: response regulator [Treponema sp.]|nr:response regulator [Treponema sp.]